MMDHRDAFVPAAFDPPEQLNHSAFRLSIDHIRRTPGFEERDWPHPMSLDDNRADLARHAADFEARRGWERLPDWLTTEALAAIAAGNANRTLAGVSVAAFAAKAATALLLLAAGFLYSRQAEHGSPLASYLAAAPLPARAIT